MCWLSENGEGGGVCVWVRKHGTVICFLGCSMLVPGSERKAQRTNRKEQKEEGVLENGTGEY